MDLVKKCRKKLHKFSSSRTSSSRSPLERSGKESPDAKERLVPNDQQLPNEQMQFVNTSQSHPAPTSSRFTRNESLLDNQSLPNDQLPQNKQLSIGNPAQSHPTQMISHFTNDQALPHEQLLALVNHVFMPPQSPTENNLGTLDEATLCHTVCRAAEEFGSTLPAAERHAWLTIPNLLKRFSSYHTRLSSFDSGIRELMDNLRSGETLAFFVHAQNAGLIIRHDTTWVVFESFEVSPPGETVVKTTGRLIRSFPGPAAQIPVEVFNQPLFLDELCGFLASMNAMKASRSQTHTVHPRYITRLLTEILTGMGSTVEVRRISKRVSDEIIESNRGDPWRRSATWLVLRVVIQTTLQRQEEEGGYLRYKAFMAFLHARILNIGLQSSLPSYYIACMQRKTARRLHKLSLIQRSFHLKYAQDAIHQAEKVLNERWCLANTAQEQSLSQTWAPKTLDIAADTVLSLINSMEHLNQSLAMVPAQESSQSFDPKHQHRVLKADNFAHWRTNELVMALNSKSNLVALADFEKAVRDNLDHWVARNLRSTEGYISIAERMEHYSAAALNAYSSNPELLSIRILTLLKLWVELDKMVLVHCPLLRKFSPEVPLNMLHHLLLPSAELIKSLEYIERYLENRYTDAVPGWSVFTNAEGSIPFAVQYFDGCSELQALKANIEEDAKKIKVMKLEEYEVLRTQYSDLKRSAEASKCQCWDGRIASTSCKRCNLEQQASKMNIEAYEWPLPQDLSMAKIVIFELMPPLSFVVWREITGCLLRDIDSSPRSLQKHHTLLLSEYPALAAHFVSDARFPRKVSVLASRKHTGSGSKSHAVEKATEKTICLDHGHEWSLYDLTRLQWSTEKYNWENTINHHCTFQLPPGPYQSLQYAVLWTSHTSNKIVADQSECPAELSFHEYAAFTGIRSGPRLQWLNILSQLRSGSLKFQEEAVFSLFRQAIWQVGPRNTDNRREWHIDPTEKEFGMLLLEEVAILLEKFKAHWHNVIAIMLITTLVSRILSLARDELVIQGCFRVMRNIRSVTYAWLRKILKKLENNEDGGWEYQRQLCTVAIACRSTYHVDGDKATTLLSDNRGVEIYIHCGILIYYNSTLSDPEADGSLRNLLHQDCRLSHMVEPLISEEIAKFGKGLDKAVTQVWQFFSPSSKWKRLPSPNNRWVTAYTNSHDGKYSQAVQLNLLSGQLLVDGRQLVQMPPDIVIHPTYTRIFGRVVPSSTGEWDFKTAYAIGANPSIGFSGYEIFFALKRSRSEQATDQLIIRAKNNEEKLELIPHETLKYDLPEFLVKDQTHWLNISTRDEIEIRDLKDLWNSSPGNWRIHISPDGCSVAHMVNNGSETLKLIDPRSRTMSMIATQLRALDDPRYMMVTWSPSTGKLSVSLPRFGLEFFLNDQSEPLLESVNMPNMVVDTDQSSGTMIGLKNQLILRKQNSPEPPLRQVIIPYLPNAEFQISASSHHHHVVAMTVGDGDTMHKLHNNKRLNLRYFKYTINPTMERLEGDGSILSKLYQIYLHAITSHCLPDRLTGRTGTEEALQELGSAGIHSFQKLGEDERQLLHGLSNLTTIRRFGFHQVPIVNNSGPTIDPLSQHDNFHTLVKSILEHEETTKIFDSTTVDYINHHADYGVRSNHLQHRAACHNAILYRDQINGPNPGPSTNPYDVVYTPRDSSDETNSADLGVVSGISAMVFRWEPELPVKISGQLFDILQQCGRISGFTKKVSLAYSHEWHNCKSAELFLPACNACRTVSKTKHQYQLAFTLSAWAYASAHVRPLIPIIFAFATIPELRASNLLPSWEAYEPAEGIKPKDAKLSDIIMGCAKELDTIGSFDREELGRRKTKFDNQRALEAKDLVRQLNTQWPCPNPTVQVQNSDFFYTEKLNKEVGKAFQEWFRNKHLYDYLQVVQNAINGLPQLTGISSPCTLSPAKVPPRPVFHCVSFQQLFCKRHPPRILSLPIIQRDPSWFQKESNTGNTQKLQDLLHEFRSRIIPSDQSGKSSAIQVQYVDDLERSLQSLKTESNTTIKHNALPESTMREVIQNYQRECAKHLQKTYKDIQESLSPSTETEKALQAALLWPPLTIRSLIGALAFGVNVKLSESWRIALNSLARALLAYQHACRLIKYIYERKLDELYSELESIIETTVDDDQHSTQLLIQARVDGDFLARRTQNDFTREMITPSSRSNSVFQLNMGEGKSSIILPMVAAALSDGSQLPRVVVLKQLAPSMFSLLVHRLGGLANRRVICMPFSRSLQLTHAQIRQIENLYSMCTRMHGVLVMQPEHILSFKLLGLYRKFNDSASEIIAPSTSSLPRSSTSVGFDKVSQELNLEEFLTKLSLSRTGGAREAIVIEPSSPGPRSQEPPPESTLDITEHLLESQKWLDGTARDILDESDEILHVRYQLVYTIGERQLLHGDSDRWSIVQQVLSLVKKHVVTVKQEFPNGLEVQEGFPGAYPFIRVLHDEAGLNLVQSVVRDISNGALEQWSFNLFPRELHRIILLYIIELNLASQEISEIEKYCKKSGFWNAILILRGLFAHNLLLFVLKERRWRIDYGLDPQRSMLAVPYRAKDSPSLRSEFSHPDMAILLTCLSYYWQGLSEKQIEECFNLLLKQDDPALFHNKWILQSPSIPDRLKHLEGIDINDAEQRKELHQHLHYNQAVVDFFLSHVVFPRDAKEFPRKISASGWDLAEERRHVTTGFSGTNDGRYLLPTTILQDDPLQQSATNARVLTYLLQTENSSYAYIQSSERTFERSILDRMGKENPKIRVLLDVGAQMWRLSNKGVATEWLSLDSYKDALAVIFYGPDDEPYVLTRNGLVEGLVSSPFRSRLEKCLLYLDDAHTRGTDFSLPLNTRAAVTLGPKVTKDRLVQGCMRMRKLGHGHSVMFFAPLDVDLRIRHAIGLHASDPIRVQDILLWAMQQSCKEVVHWIPRWAQQGVYHRRRREAWNLFKGSSDTPVSLLKSAWIQNENWSLDDMYAPRHPVISADHLRQFQDYPDIMERYQKWAPLSFRDTRIEEEDEREVMLEIERERRLAWQPPKATASTPHTHDDVRQLVATGTFKATSSAFLPLFKPLGLVAFEKNAWSSSHLVATKEFFNTVDLERLEAGTDPSNYLRPIHWILSAPQSNGAIFVVLSPDEVNDLLPEIRSSDRVHLHLYAPRLTKSMKSTDDLTFYCIPPLPASWVPPELGIRTRLNVWAGQLYLSNYEQYQYLCKFLGLYSWKPSEDDIIQPDGFVKPEHRPNTPIDSCSSFQDSPVPYLKKLLELRRKGIGYFPTHIGQILHGRLLTEENILQG
ncbi:hypothetical protein FRC02_008778 [Tulasnella sp. 418]|nr:hypothetical protein FRC02_008778 [Tulasnella sp. 418]